MPGHLNYGFYFSRSNVSTILAMEKVVKHASTLELSRQQASTMYHVGMVACLDSKTNLTCVFLDHNLFPNGAYESLWEKHDVGATRMKKGYLILHNNWISGRMRKLECQVLSGLGHMIPDLECVCWQMTHS